MGFKAKKKHLESICRWDVNLKEAISINLGGQNYRAQSDSRQNQSMSHILTQEDKSNFYREQTGENLLYCWGKYYSAKSNIIFLLDAISLQYPIKILEMKHSPTNSMKLYRNVNK